MDKAIPIIVVGFALTCLWISRQIGADWAPTMNSAMLIVLGAVLAAGFAYWSEALLPLGTRVAIFPVFIWPGSVPVLDNLADKASSRFVIPGDEPLITYLGSGWVQFLIWLALVAIAVVTYIRGRDSY